MKTIVHLIKKDLRCVWPLVAVWYLLIAIRIPVLLFYTYGAEGLALSYMAVFARCAVFADALLIMGIVRGLVHEDPLVGDRAFWVTRPIGRGRLLSAKTLCAGLVCIIAPLLLLVPTWITLDLGVSDVFRLVQFHCIFALIFTLLGMAFAVVTNRSVTFWLAIALSLTGAVILGFVVLNWYKTEQNLIVTRVLLAALVFSLLVAAGVVVQFYLRRRAWPVGFYTAATCLGFIIFVSWPIEMPRLLMLLKGEYTSNVLVNLEWPTGGIPLENFSKGNRCYIRGNLAVTLPYKYREITTELLDFEWIYKDGTRERAGRIDRRLNDGVARHSSSTCARKVESGFAYDLPLNLSMPQKWRDEGGDARVHFKGRFRIDYLDTLDLPDLELTPGAISRGTGYVTRLLSVENGASGLRCTWLESSPLGAAGGLARLRSVPEGRYDMETRIVSCTLLGITLRTVTNTVFKPDWQVERSSAAGAAAADHGQLTASEVQQFRLVRQVERVLGRDIRWMQTGPLSKN